MIDERSRIFSVKELRKVVEAERALVPEPDHERPRTRADCVDGLRPCPYVSCRYHLYLDVSSKTGALKLNFPDREVEDMSTSCALDVADAGDITLEVMSGLMNLTREGARQIENSALIKLRKKLDQRDLSQP
jgi:hypothetical protein